MNTKPDMILEPDVIIIGAGAAGLFAAIHAGRSGAKVLVLDGARSIGVKILVAGGGRCNVTHHHVDEKAFAGSSRNAIRKILRRFDADDTVEFFKELDVELKQEDTGKLFPVTDDARTILNALIKAAEEAGAQIKFPRRVDTIEPSENGFIVGGDWGQAQAPRLIIATGGKALPKSGSDGGGLDMMHSLGHSLTDDILPALVPLILPGEHPLRELSGITLPATLSVQSPTGKILHSFTNSLLLTHFGLSGPAALDISRYWRAALLADPGTRLHANFLPSMNESELDSLCQAQQSTTPLSLLKQHLAERFAKCLCGLAGIDPNERLGQLSRDQRRAFARTCTNLTLPIEGDRGFTHAEVTMGGVPLSEVRLDNMESRIVPGLHLIGEILDVDGRIGGFNFQWAWATGYIAGTSFLKKD
tara:strand:+ start:1309 stop:2559 length:1251 start_codon:yes stop_codon:yes gene_type:complete